MLYDGLAFHKVKLPFALTEDRELQNTNYPNETDGLLEPTIKAYLLMTGRLIIG